jgi:phosphonate transport system substrate-binding protein
MIRILATLLFVCLSPVAALSQNLPLRFGVFPNLSAPVLLEAHQPLADHLSHALKRPVYLETAPDFASFVTRTRQGRYDLLLTPPHLAFLAVTEAGYRPLYAYANPIQGMLVVRKQASFQSLTDLKGQTIAMADPLAIVVMMMEAELRRVGLLEGRDFARLEAGSHNNAALLVVQGKAQGAVLGALPFQQLPADIRQDLRPVAFTKPVLSQVYLASARLPDADLAALSLALKGFPETPTGREFFRRGALRGLVSISSDALQPFSTYGAEAVRRLEGQGRP